MNGALPLVRPRTGYFYSHPPKTPRHSRRKLIPPMRPQRVTGPAPAVTISSPRQLRSQRREEPAPIMPNPNHKTVRSDSGSGPLGSPAFAYRVVDETPRTRPAPPPEPAVEHSHLSRYRQWAAKQTDLPLAERARLESAARCADAGPMPAADPSLSHAENTRLLNAWYATMGLSIRGSACATGFRTPPGPGMRKPLGPAAR